MDIHDAPSPVVGQYDELIAQHPKSADLHMQRGETLFSEGQLDAAIEDLERAVQLDSSLFGAWQTLADAYLSNIQSRKALETLEAMVQIFPDSIHAQLKLSEFQLILKRYREAIEILQHIHQLDPNNADAYFVEGMLHKDMGDTSGAIYHFQLATREDPKLIDAWINLGQLLEQKGDPEAIRYFEAGLLVAPRNITLLRSKAQYLARQAQIPLAKSTYRDLLHLDPDDSQAYYDLGLLYLDQDSLKKAQQHFDIATKTEPGFGRAYFYLAMTHELMKQIDQARFYYQQAQKLTPDDPDIGVALERVESAR